MEPAIWRSTTYVTKNAIFGRNLPLLVCGGFKFSQFFFFFMFRGGTQLFSFSDGEWKTKDVLRGW